MFYLLAILTKEGRKCKLVNMIKFTYNQYNNKNLIIIIFKKHIVILSSKKMLKAFLHVKEQERYAHNDHFCHVLY